LVETAAPRAKQLEYALRLPQFRPSDLNGAMKITVADDGLDVVLFQKFLGRDLADAIFRRLLDGLPWYQVLYQKYGKQFRTPRYTTVFGTDDSDATESCYKYPRSPIPEGLRPLLQAVTQVAKNEFNFMLFNLYLDNTQSISFHSDDESFLGPNPTIASLSLGAPRRFLLRRKSEHQKKYELLLNSGDLLVMRGRTQHDWEHAVPKSAKSATARINITFRRAINSGGTNNYYRYNRYGDRYNLFTYDGGAMVPLDEDKTTNRIN
jgi:alkylated DNA repair dioxygenase AlkB